MGYQMTDCKPCTFKDKKARMWDLTLDLRTARYIDKCDFSGYTEKFSILKPEKKLFWRFLEDSALLFAIAWAIVQEQAEEAFAAGSFPCSPKEDPEAAELEFVSGINGQAREDGKQAFVEALIDFFPEQRTVLSTLQNSLKTMRTKIDQKVMEAEPLMDELINLEMADAVEQMLKNLQETRERKAGVTS